MSLTPSSVNRNGGVASDQRSAASGSTLFLLCACFVLSGIAALVYQTAWTRQFAIVFGTSELAVATVLAAYMGGLALGAWLAEKFLPRVTRPVLTYALLELGIALGAIVAVPLLLWLANAGLLALFGGQPAPPDSEHAGTTLFYLVSAFAALALPTTLMGATLPMLARYAVAEESQIGRRIGLLYALNTAGAVLGALVTAFLLLPELGLRKTIWFAAGLNGLVFLFAAALAQRVPPAGPPKGYALDAAPEPVVTRPRTPVFTRVPAVGWVLPMMLLAGAIAFFQEVLWARMLSQVVGSSIYAFGVMVASFLTGIAAGGAVGAALGRTRERAAMFLAIALLVAALAAALAYLNLEALLPTRAGLLQNVREVAGVALPMNALFSGLLLLPMTLAIGMTYPLAVRVLARDADDAAPASARVYAWNTVGAILGSLAAGFVLIPLLKYEGAIRVAVWASAALGIAALWVLLPLRRAVAVGASVAAIVACAFFMPQPPMKLVVTSPLNVDTGGRVLYYDLGRSASVVMLAQGGGLTLRTNGLPEALMDSPGSVPRFSGEYWLSPLAVIARPQADDMLIVGFGGGVVVEGVPPSVDRIDVIELEPKVIEANRRTSTLRKRDPLADRRVNVILNDARGALTLTEHRYDVIISQPSHPWTAGASHLYTREFMQLAHDHLSPDGVFVQWMNVMFMDEDLLRSLTATLLSVFAEVRVYRPDPETIVFLASDGKLELESQLAATGLPLREAPMHYARFGINNAEDVIVALALDAEGARRLALGAPLITDDDNRIATSSVYEKGRGMTREASGRVLAAHDPLQRPDSFVYGSLRERISLPYLVRRSGIFVQIDASAMDRVRNIARILGNSAEGEYARAFFYRLQGQGQRSQEILRLAVDQYPDDPDLRQEYLRSHIPALARGQATPEVREVAEALSGPAALLLQTAMQGAKGDLRAVVAADAGLAEIGWRDPWYAEALELRVDWRTQVSSPEHMRRFGDEAIPMVDRMIVMTPSLLMLKMRAQAGLAAQRPDVVVESLSNYARLSAEMGRRRQVPPEALKNDAVSVRAFLDRAAAMPGVDAPRLEEVRGEVAAMESIS
jgi:spermidine synthase